jgi:hypothetical protein
MPALINLVPAASVCRMRSCLNVFSGRSSDRYIEIFKSSMGECQAVFGNQRGGMRPPMGMGMGRPGPYDRGERFGPMGMGMGMGPMGPMGPPMGPFPGRGRGRNVKGITHF